jgi:hypothetical protein
MGDVAAFQKMTLCVGDREARPDSQGGELIDRIAATAPIRKLLFVEALGHARVPFAGYRPDHRAGVELATIDAHRAAEAAADLEGRLDDGLAREARRDRFEIRDFAGRGAAGHSVPPRSVKWVRTVLNSMRTNDKTVLPACVLPGGKGGLPPRFGSPSQREKRKRHVGGWRFRG